MTTATRRSTLQRRRWIAFLMIAVLIGVACAPAVLLRVRAARLLLATLDANAGSGALALATDTVRASDERIALADGTHMRSRRYSAEANADAPVLLLLHGVHPRGIDEARLQRFARALAAGGLEVHTPELPELLSLDVSASVVPRIAACAAALRAQHRGRKPGAIGISLNGGLVLMSAATGSAIIRTEKRAFPPFGARPPLEAQSVPL